MECRHGQAAREAAKNPQSLSSNNRTHKYRWQRRQQKHEREVREAG
jgi:hypothetical protein